jgi:membrane-associated phospholipid phosphatase
VKTQIKIVVTQLRQFLILYSIVLLGCLIIKLLYSRETIYFTVNSWHWNFTDQLAPYITDLGEGWTVVIISLIWAYINFRGAFLLATSWGVTSILAQILKPIFHAPRPKLYFEHQLNRIHFVKGVDILSHSSFPSGHTVTAFSAAVVFAYLCRNKNWSAVFLLLAMIVGFSRMYLSQHFFEDVTGGSIIGVLITVIWISWLDSKKFIHSEGWNRGFIVSSE